MNDNASPPLFDDYPDVLSLTQMCEIMQICRQSGYKLLKNGEIPYKKVGRKYIISKKQLVTYVNSK
ncbi:MAG: helix-turn-helix domain-containing protein [Pseudomonadaceae bacterium]|nr:helix-turn-helix domain-containing protein [Pseudomonadaceae bacterium]